MKEHNQLVRFKNSFVTDPQKKETVTSIISEDMNTVLHQKLAQVLQIYSRETMEGDYDPALAFRIITLCLLAHNKSKINLLEEVNRLFRHSLKSRKIEDIQLCFDLLLLNETKDALSEQHLRLYKMRLLKGLRAIYQSAKKKDCLKKCRFTLLEYCRGSLLRDRVKHNLEVYSQILDALIEEVKMKVSSFVKKKNIINAIQQMMSFIGILEKSEQIVSSKYQNELMSAYWSLAHLHNQLHYLAYTRKYATIALNIAQRLNNSQAVHQLKLMLEKLI